MSTVKKLVYRVWGMLDGNIESSVESRFTYREIREAVVSGVASAMRRRKFEDANNPDASRYSNDFDTKTYRNQAITVDAETQLKKMILPATMVAFHDGRQISVFDNTELSFGRGQLFIPIKREEVVIMKTQEFKPSYVVYFVEEDNLLFWGEFEDETLNITLKGSIPKDDDIVISAPDDMMNMICEEAYKILAPQVKQDDNAVNGVPSP